MAFTNFGTMIGNAGVDAAFSGGPTKPFALSAVASPSILGTAANYIAKNWSAITGAPTVPSSLGPVTQSYVISQAVVAAPYDVAFLGSSLSTTIELDGSNDGATWTTLASASTAGLKGETITLTPPSSTPVFYAFHRIALTGDGVHAAAIALAEMYAAGPSAAQTGSELGA